ncbi:hypothetical protein LTR66_012557 [Elasticomyces elasticus]|nr:hypothetical protein LTR66_012557 [Elasticomyces elasticus]
MTLYPSNVAIHHLPLEQLLLTTITTTTAQRKADQKLIDETQHKLDKAEKQVYDDIDRYREDFKVITWLRQKVEDMEWTKKIEDMAEGCTERMLGRTQKERDRAVNELEQAKSELENTKAFLESARQNLNIDNSIREELGQATQKLRGLANARSRVHNLGMHLNAQIKKNDQVGVDRLLLIGQLCLSANRNVMLRVEKGTLETARNDAERHVTDLEWTLTESTKQVIELEVDVSKANETTEATERWNQQLQEKLDDADNKKIDLAAELVQLQQKYQTDIQAKNNELTQATQERGNLRQANQNNLKLREIVFSHGLDIPHWQTLTLELPEHLDVSLETMIAAVDHFLDVWRTTVVSHTSVDVLFPLQLFLKAQRSPQDIVEMDMMTLARLFRSGQNLNPKSATFLHATLKTLVEKSRSAPVKVVLDENAMNIDDRPDAFPGSQETVVASIEQAQPVLANLKISTQLFLVMAIDFLCMLLPDSSLEFIDLFNQFEDESSDIIVKTAITAMTEQISRGTTFNQLLSMNSTSGWKWFIEPIYPYEEETDGSVTDGTKREKLVVFGRDGEDFLQQCQVQEVEWHEYKETVVLGNTGQSWRMPLDAVEFDAFSDCVLGDFAKQMNEAPKLEGQEE